MLLSDSMANVHRNCGECSRLQRADPEAPGPMFCSLGIFKQERSEHIGRPEDPPNDPPMQDTVDVTVEQPVVSRKETEGTSDIVQLMEK